MSLNLSKTVADFLAKHAEQKFTARQIAEWTFQQFPAECQEKKANSKNIEDDDDLVQQIAREIGAYRPALQKKNPQIKTTESRPRQYYWSEKSEQAEVAVIEDQGADEHLLSGGASIKESDLGISGSIRMWSGWRI